VQLKLYREGIAPIQHGNIWDVIAQEYATDVLQAVHLENGHYISIITVTRTAILLMWHTIWGLTQPKACKLGCVCVCHHTN